MAPRDRRGRYGAAAKFDDFTILVVGFTVTDVDQPLPGPPPRKQP